MIIDIAMNATDKSFQGIYHNKQKHSPDLNEVIMRAKTYGVMPLFVGTNETTSIESIRLAKEYNTLAYVGVHPCDSNTDYHFLDKELLNNDHVVCLGECGLDYARLNYADIKTQKKCFNYQLELNHSRYFLHVRDAFRDFFEMIDDYKLNGIVHSFTGSYEEYRTLIKKGFWVGINGCSLKNIDFMEEIDIDRTLLGSDAPYCSIKKNYEPLIKTKIEKIKRHRNEPSSCRNLLEILAHYKNMDESKLEEQLLENAFKFYGEKLEKASKLFLQN